MTTPPDPNTQAILLLTAPFRTGAARDASESLSLGEYNGFALALHEAGRAPADLLGVDAETLIQRCGGALDTARLRRLLARGFALAQAWDEWQARGIWVVSRAEARYPKRLRERLERFAPPVLFGCGELALGERGGLAIVGSRSAKDDELAFARATGALAASAGRVVVSGGARGVDSAAMLGALDAGGCVVGVLADGLARAAVDRSYRDALQTGRLLLLSTTDPGAGFCVGFAMQRNRLIYALADAALVVRSESGKGGTWTGAVEQLDKLRFVPVFVRITGDAGKGSRALRDRGALPWPEPRTAGELGNVLTTASPPAIAPARAQGELPFGAMAVREPTPPSVNPSPESPSDPRTRA